jgi:hypothetical protein
VSAPPPVDNGRSCSSEESGAHLKLETAFKRGKKEIIEQNAEWVFFYISQIPRSGGILSMALLKASSIYENKLILKHPY